MKTHVYTSAACLDHITGGSHADYGHVPAHPERPERLETLLGLFREKPFNTLPVIEGPRAERAWLLYAHPARYIDFIRGLIPENGLYDLDSEAVLSPGTWEAALHAAGAVCRAVEDVANGRCSRAFCAVRPPGHHAEAEKAMGFCLFANVFIGARYAQENCGIKRVAVVDFDVHHGNGTDALARSADGIFLVSSHQYPLWPMTGLPENDEPGKTLSVPLAPHTGGAEMRAAYEEKVFPALHEFGPDLLMISAGFDAHRDDPLANLEWTEEDYAWLTGRLCAVADEHCGGRIVSTLEGGYDLTALKNSVAAHLKALAGL